MQRSAASSRSPTSTAYPTFIAKNDGQKRLKDGGVKVVFPVEHLHDKIVEVSMAGHARPVPNDT
jgi:hypothetical protein